MPRRHPTRPRSRSSRPTRSRFWPRRRDRRRILRATMVGGIILLIAAALVMGTLPGSS